MALVALGPSLDGVGDVVAEESAVGVVGEVAQSCCRFSRLEDTAETIEGRAVPEGKVSGLGSQSIGRPEAWRE